MVPFFLICAALAAPQAPDSATFRDAATAALYTRARVRHVRQDSLVRNYRAVVQTRLTATAGRSRFARQITLVQHESVAEIAWEEPNDLRVKVLGARAVAPVVRIVQGFGGKVEAGAEAELRDALVMDRPWFIPRALGDSVRLMGVPEHAALHPLADGALEYYRFAVTDSVQLLVPGRSVRAFKMRVEPKRIGPSLIAGDMWIDAESADVVRFSMTFLGDYVWEAPRGETAGDSARALKDNAQARRFLSVEAMVEYALVDRQYWMPYRQLMAITAEVPWFVNVAVPATAVTTFSDYRVNVDEPIAFVVPEEALESGETRRRLRARPGESGLLSEDTVFTRRERQEAGYFRAGLWSTGRWELEVPAADSLRAYPWAANLQTLEDPREQRRLREMFVELSTLREDLPFEWTGRRRLGLAWEAAADVVRFNRVQGPSLGVGFELHPGPRFTTVLASGRFGFGDLRPTATLTWRRDGPVGRFDVAGYHTVREAEPWTRGLGLGNSVNALFVAHDDADYFRVSGGAVSHTWNYGVLANVEARLAYEHHASMDAITGSAIADLWGEGAFPPNPAVTDGWFVRGVLRRGGWIGPLQVTPGSEVLAGEGLLAGRAWIAASLPFTVLGRGGRLTVRSGALRGDSMPQLEFRLGGPETVRGYVYGVRRGREIWAAQLDLALTRSRLLAPVAFVDVGDTFTSDPMVGAGVGLSVLNGLIRFNLSKGLRPVSEVRFDLLFRAPR